MPSDRPSLADLKAAAESILRFSRGEHDDAAYTGTDHDRDAVALAEYVAGLADAPVTAVRVEYVCTRGGRADLRATFDSRWSDNEQAAAEFADRVRARECCTLTAIVRTYAVELRAAEEAEGEAAPGWKP